MKKKVTETAQLLATTIALCLLSSAIVTPSYNMLAWDFNLPQYSYWKVSIIILGARFLFKSVTGKIENTNA